MTCRCTALATLLLFAASCRDDERAPPPLLVAVDDGEGLPVPGAGLRVGSWVHTTDARGEARLIGEGARRPLAVELVCPPRHLAQSPARREVLPRTVSPLGDAVVPDARFVCRPRTRSQVLVIVAGVPGLPVLVDGTPRAETDADGTAHLLVEGATGEGLTVILDTRARPRLRPASPNRRFTFAATSQLLLFQQTFMEKQTPPARSRPAKRSRGPRRL